MTQPMPPMYAMPPRPRTSAAAVTSMILGILGCVPFATGLFAVILGIVGLRAAAKPGMGGRGFAIAGLILGVLSLLGWIGFGGAFYVAYRSTAPARAQCRLFLQDVSDGKVTDAQSLCVDSVTLDEVDALADQLKSAGSLNDVTFMSFNVQANPGQSSTMVAGSAIFQHGPKSVSFTLISTSAGLKIQKWDVK
jgi:Domain of unknown function (DUF4190)